MKKRKILIPQPKSRFILVKCPDCENEQIIFDHATIKVECNVCGKVLAQPSGGKAIIYAKILKVLG
ncbi:MAG: 30S ribosomal protein S27e [Thermofilum sp. ex4484_82]|nr:30S ribosomal protein S27e [Thermoproteales archaeon]OYT25633.1 MAG: 30S ribosomal protein S27e [Thermofilum sp. ex4484_82]OYT36147.1 MAG: 30S ribosomal protein S27e [Archaeoglobales archaeon ex4484_92]RLE77026.1 MAG: 30S ribosomal protein S27e [Thermoprotei archaeon]RLE86072.1 MAG: 30S ribosomal protein S27e [Thermoprotei archaeon]